MALFTIWREFDPGARPAHLEANVARAIAASIHFPSVRWLRTYALDVPGRIAGFCVYDAPARAHLLDHHAYCRVPYVEIREVDEELGADPVAAVPEALFPGRLFLDEGRTFAPSAGARTLRSYRDRDGDYRRRIVGGTQPPGATPILMAHPSEWADIYDSIGLPRHWEAAPAPAEQAPRPASGRLLHHDGIFTIG